MKKTFLLDEIKTTLLTEDEFLLGKKDLVKQDESNCNATMLIKGDSLKISGSDLYIGINDSLPPGELAFRPASFPSGGLKPTTMQRPFEMRYAFSNPLEASRNWIGQDAYSIKTYKPFQFAENAIEESLYLANTFMFSHKGSLYFVSERRETVDTQSTLIVTLYKMIGYQWNTVYKFSSNPVDIWDYEDTTSTTRRLQIGSPSAVSANDQIYISYRVVDRSSSTMRLLVFRGEDSFDLISDTVVKDHPPIENSIEYRQRLAYGSGQFMLVSYGIYSNGDNRIRDFRTYLSTDEGYTFNSKSESYRSVILNDTVRFENTSAFFICKQVNDESDISGNVNFSLCYDERNSCFVLAKGGDGDNMDFTSNSLPELDGSNYLIVLVAYSKNPFDWEQVAKYKLEGSNIGYIDTTSFEITEDPLEVDSQSVSKATNPLWIQDCCLISNGKEMFIFASLYSSTYDWNTILTKFVLADQSLMPKGYSEKIFTHGQKIHKNLSFIIDPIDPSQTGFAHAGAPSFEKNSLGGNQIMWNGLMGCFWRNQIAMSARLTDIASDFSNAWNSYYDSIFDRYVSLAICGKQSNLSEEYGYEFSFPIGLRRFRPFNMNNALLGGTAFFDTTTGLYKYEPSTASGLYAQMSRSIYPNLIQRALSSNIPLFKTRFQAMIENDGSVSQIEIFRWEARSDTSTSLNVVCVRMFVDSSGYVRFANHDFALSAPMFQIQFDTKYDFSIITEYSNGPLIFVSYKKESEETWNIFECDLDFTAYSSGPVLDIVRIGYVSASALPTTTSVSIGDIHMSVYGSGYKPQLRRDSKQRGLERITRPALDGLGSCRPLSTLSREIDLIDGSLILVDDVLPNQISVSHFKVKNMRQPNSIKNIELKNPSLPYFYSSIFTGSDKSILFRNDDALPAKKCCLINSVGCESLVIKYGFYDEDTSTWSSFSTDSHNWPYLEVPVIDYFERTLVLDYEFQTGELEGRHIWIRNDTSGLIEIQNKILYNEGPILNLEWEIDTLNDRTILIPDLSASFDINSSVPFSHIEFTLSAIENNEMFISTIKTGNLIELSDAVSTMQESTKTIDKVNTSDRGNSFPSYSEKVAITNKYDFTLQNLVINSSYYRKVLDTLTRNKKMKKDTVLITEGEEVTIDYGFICELGGVPSGNEIDINFCFESASFNNDAKDYAVYPSRVEIRLSHSDLLALEDFSVQAITDFEDETGLEFLWDFGDGTTSTNSTETHQYGSTGFYNLSLTITDQYGNESVKTITVWVKAPQIVDYALSATGPSPYTVTITARDYDNQIVVDNSTSLTITFASPAATPTSVRLIDGVATTTITSTPTTATIYFIDSEGRSWYKTVSLP